MTLRREVGDRQEEAGAWLDLCTFEIQKGQYEKAEEYAQQAKNIFKETGNEYGVAKCNGNLGIIELTKGNRKKAKKIIRETVDVFDSRGDEDSLAAAYSELGHVAAIERRFDDAIEWFEKAATNYYEVGNVGKLAAVYYNMADCYFKRGNQLISLSVLKVSFENTIQTNSYALLYPIVDYIYDISTNNIWVSKEEELFWIFLGRSVANKQGDENWGSYFTGKYHMSLSGFYPDLYQLVMENDDVISLHIGMVMKLLKKPEGMTNHFGPFTDGEMVLQMIQRLLNASDLGTPRQYTS